MFPNSRDLEPKELTETPNGETIPVQGVHEANFLGRHLFNQKVFIVSIVDDVLLGLDIMQKCKFICKERPSKIDDDTIPL